MKKHKVHPNFYCSEEYLRFSDATCFTENGWVWVESDGWALFPPLPMNKWRWSYEIPYYWEEPIWADFIDTVYISRKMEFLDIEFIYNPKAFKDLSGGDWNVYRKNIRKYPKRHEKWVYSNSSTYKEVTNLLGEWLEGKKDVVEDVNFILRFVTDYSTQRKFLYDGEGNLVAINAWDENYKYINYRFCITKPNQPFLEEFTRHQFYIDPVIQDSGKFVNDGGCLGSEGLKRFKRKMNPVQERDVHSWIFKNNNHG
jgi:hypothetical protein